MQGLYGSSECRPLTCLPLPQIWECPRLHNNLSWKEGPYSRRDNRVPFVLEFVESEDPQTGPGPSPTPSPHLSHSRLPNVTADALPPKTPPHGPLGALAPAHPPSPLAHCS